MTLEDYEALLAAQNGTCAICGHDGPRRGTRFHVDHDHESGAVRGLLCDTCNKGIGMFGDKRHLLLEAYWYLLRHTGS